MSNTKLILFLAANPIDAKEIKNSTNWKKEYRLLESIINQSKLSDYYSLSLEADATSDDFLTRLDENPWIIHFSGHGNEKEILLQDGYRKPFRVSIATLLDNLRHASGLECIVFSSCFSRGLIEETRKIVKYSIGFEGELQNSDANQFVKDFYKCLEKPDVNTIYHAYQRTISRYNLRQQTKAKPVFESRRLYIMNEIILKKNYELKSHLSLEGQKELAVLELEMSEMERNIETMSSDSTVLYSKLLKVNPFANGVLWFIENKAEIVVQLAERVLASETRIKQNYFAEELDIMFDFLKSSLVNFDYRDFTKSDLEVVEKTFSIEPYKEAFDVLPTLFPQVINSYDFHLYLLDNISYIKKLI